MNEIEKAQPTAMDLIRQVVNSPEIPADKCVAVMQGLQQMYERDQDRNAEREFNTAFVQLQRALPVIVAKTPIENRGKYEKFEDVMAVVQPILERHGFAVSFSQDFIEPRYVVTCTLTHIGGHSRKNSFGVRPSPPQVARSGRVDPLASADCKASTTAKRNALCQILNIVIRQDCFVEEEDAGMESDTVISADLAENLHNRVTACGADEKAFLKFAGATSFETIKAAKYDEVNRALRQKESKR